MGLDAVELVMAYEEAFGVEITDEEAAACRTPRMVIDLVFSKVRTADERVCRSQRVFYIIRRVLVQMFGLERRSITPDLRFREQVPKDREKEMWERIEAALSPRDWPGLVRPVWMSQLLIALGLAIFIAAVLAGFFCLPPIIGSGAAGWAGLMLLGTIPVVLFGVLAAVLTRPSRIYIRSDLQSVRDLIPYAITSARMPAWTREDIAAVVKRLTMHQLGIDEADYTEDSRFVEDFNID